MIALSAVVLVLLRRGITRLNVMHNRYLSRYTCRFLPHCTSHFILDATKVTTTTATLTRFVNTTVTLGVLFNVPVLVNDVLATLVYAIVLVAGSCHGLRQVVTNFMSLVTLTCLIRMGVIGIS